ncbi:MAG: ABC transporter ATP-binding protein [Acidimicrobiales bacterium]|jgi:simple sugar transport system ATP-binding protein|nr:ABC transporter ATP-binding protein [Acidimicrobiales bacterium]
MDTDGRTPVLEMRGVTKTFPGVVANEDVDLTLFEREIHCLLGENGAGKSTLMNVAFGLYQPDGGELLVRGRPARFDSSSDAIATGIGMVHQHFQLVPVFTVAENVILGNELRKGAFLDMGEARRRIRELSERYGLAVDPDALVGDLSVGEQQRVELIKALFREADILILDEPTAVLTPGEVDEFFGVVRSLVDQGKSIIFITHKLREVLAVADRITVLRGGKVVGTADPATATQQTLANLMVGRDVVFDIHKEPAKPGETVVSVRGLSVLDERGALMVDGLDLDVRSGEIFGVAGVQGNGQRELVEAIVGMRPKVAGTVEIGGHDATRMTPRHVTELGVGHIPEDRNKHGLVSSYTIADNLVLNRYNKAPFARRGIRDAEAIDAEARTLVEQFDVRTPGTQVAVSTLSGGNQQKVIVARELSHAVRLLIAAQPTRGLDVGSIEFIHRRIIELRDQGSAVLLVSAELDEILTLADRIGVLYRGRMVGVFDRADVTREELGYLMATGAAPSQELTVQ